MLLFVWDTGMHGRSCSLPEVTRLAIHPGVPSSPTHTFRPFSWDVLIWRIKFRYLYPLTTACLSPWSGCHPAGTQLFQADLVICTYCLVFFPPLCWCSCYLLCPLFPRLADSGLPLRCTMDYTESLPWNLPADHPTVLPCRLHTPPGCSHAALDISVVLYVTHFIIIMCSSVYPTRL